MRMLPDTYLNNLKRRLDRRAAYLGLALFMLFIFGDTLMPALGHALHLVIEAIEAVLEHFLESAFGLSERQAQITLFYSAMAASTYLVWYLLRQAYFSALCAYYKAQMRYRMIMTTTNVRVWFRMMVTMSALITTFYLFT
jgi:hypothetical protein